MYSIPSESSSGWRTRRCNEKYHAVLRMDPLLNDWPRASRDPDRARLRGRTHHRTTHHRIGQEVFGRLGNRMKPLYMAVSLPPSFGYPEDSPRAQVDRRSCSAVCRSHNLPFSMMIGARKQVNPALKDAGDSLGHAETAVVERLCRDFPENKFLVSCFPVKTSTNCASRPAKFNNLMPFGCWWFLNDASIVTEITDERFELLGTSFIPQHSDARILDQLVYKWDHSRRRIADSLTRAYAAWSGTAGS